jgi:repressor LexA
MGRKPKDDHKAFLFIANHLRQHGTQPSFKDIAKEMGYSSMRSVQLLLKRLVETKRITYEGRVMDVVDKVTPIVNDRTVDIPILAQVPCGSFEEAVEDPKGSIKVSSEVVRPGSNYYILEAKGNSMNAAGICSGDLMLIRQQATADNNDIVVALVNGAATVKRFKRHQDFVVLTPESHEPEHQPMIFYEDFAIQGKVMMWFPNPYKSNEGGKAVRH